jgi:cephalosporin hydroxylase
MGETPKADGRHFVLSKDRAVVDHYAAFRAGLPTFDPRRVLEVSVWAGGSIVFWAELLDPDCLVAIDIARPDQMGPANAKALQLYLDERATGRGRIAIHWQTDQGDARRLRDIVRRDLDGSVDLVIDDASHMYDLTRRTFEAMFPAVRPGGWYVIEHWAWDLWPTFQAPTHPWAL